MSGRVWILGLDGATYDLLTPLVEEGSMPNLGRLLAEGAAGPLRSTIPPVTPAAWSTFATGMNPGKHGVFGFAGWSAGGRRTWVSRRSLRAPTLWQRAGRAGRSVGVINVPVTYPAEEVPGFLIPGFLTPRSARDFAHPPGLIAEIEGAVGPYIVNVEIAGRPLRGPADVERLLEEIHRAEAQRWAALQYCLERFAPDLIVAVFMGLDKVQHLLWKALDRREPFSQTPEGTAYRQLALPLYRQVDEFLGQVRAQLGPEDALILLSDHGFGPLCAYVDANVWLQQQGWLRVRWSTLLRQRLQRRLRRGRGRARLHAALALDPEQGAVLDWSRTRAFAGDIYEQGFHLNQGAFADEEERQAFLHTLEERLRDWRSPLDGQPLVSALHRREEVYRGPYAEQAPDLLVVLRDYAVLLRSRLPLRPGPPVHPVAGPEGYHRREGILLLWGRPIAQGVPVQGAAIEDVAPTALHLLGLEVPTDMDGRVLEEAFTPAFRQARPPRRAETVGKAATPAEEAVYSAEDEAEIEERLRALGYL